MPDSVYTGGIPYTSRMGNIYPLPSYGDLTILSRFFSFEIYVVAFVWALL